MTSLYTDKDLPGLIQKLKQDLKEFPAGMETLEVELESASKHVPAYLKIVKSHIEQLATVLELENHNRRNLENAGLAEPVKQLIQLFKDLNDEDLETLENLSLAARTWQEPQVQDLKESHAQASVSEV